MKLFPLFLALLFLGSCSAIDKEKTSKEKPAEPVKKIQSDRPIIEESKAPKTQQESSKQEMCVFETIRGIAEIQHRDQEVVRLRFFPGNEGFSVPANALPNYTTQDQNEFKTLKLEPISGDCKDNRFQFVAPSE